MVDRSPPSASASPHEDDIDSVDYYALLGVSRTASLDDLRKAYKQKALQYHPDKTRHLSSSQDTTAHFQKISHAYHVLSDETLRRQYDEAGSVSAEDLFQEDPRDYFRQVIERMDPRWKGFFQETYESISHAFRANPHPPTNVWQLLETVDTDRILYSGVRCVSSLFKHTLSSRVRQEGTTPATPFPDKIYHSKPLRLSELKTVDEGVNVIPLEFMMYRMYTHIRLTFIPRVQSKTVPVTDTETESMVLKSYYYDCDLSYDNHSFEIQGVRYDFRLDDAFPENMTRINQYDVVYRYVCHTLFVVHPFLIRIPLSSPHIPEDQRIYLRYNVELGGKSTILKLEQQGLLRSVQGTEDNPVSTYGILWVSIEFATKLVYEQLPDVNPEIQTIQGYSFYDDLLAGRISFSI